MFLNPFFSHFQKRYAGKYRYAKAVFFVDLLLVGIALGLLITVLILFLFHPQDKVAERITFETQTAPPELISGASATLVTRYHNGNNEGLKDVKLHLTFPQHFKVDTIEVGGQKIEGDITIGTIPPGGDGSIKIHGVILGEMGKPELFQSTLTYRSEKHNRVGKKSASYTVSPIGSTLGMKINLPETIVSRQPFQGSITYKNTGSTDLPAILIIPSWPPGFSLKDSSLPLVEGGWSIPGPVPADSEGTILFRGMTSENTDHIRIDMDSFFQFGSERLHQETITQDIALVQPQLQLNQSVDASTVRPGGTMKLHIRAENTGDTPLRNLRFTIISDSPFVKTPTPTISLPTLAGKEVTEMDIDVPLRSSIQTSETKTYENLSVSTTIVGTYLQGEGDGQEISSQSAPLSYPLTTSVILQSFGRFYSEQGDQIGRGPLPPIWGEQTKYWILWRISGTFNPLKDVKIVGTLPQGVTFTGAQTVSKNGALDYDPVANTLTWTTATLDPTFGPQTNIVGIAFEVAITPTEDQLGKSPSLLSKVILTAIDAKTNAFVSASGTPVTTHLTHDKLAEPFGQVSL